MTYAVTVFMRKGFFQKCLIILKAMIGEFENNLKENTLFKSVIDQNTKNNQNLFSTT